MGFRFRVHALGFRFRVYALGLGLRAEGLGVSLPNNCDRCFGGALHGGTPLHGDIYTSFKGLGFRV